MLYFCDGLIVGYYLFILVFSFLHGGIIKKLLWFE